MQYKKLQCMITAVMLFIASNLSQAQFGGIFVEWGPEVTAGVANDPQSVSPFSTAVFAGSQISYSSGKYIS